MLLLCPAIPLLHPLLPSLPVPGHTPTFLLQVLHVLHAFVCPSRPFTAVDHQSCRCMFRRGFCSSASFLQCSLFCLPFRSSRCCHTGGILLPFCKSDNRTSDLRGHVNGSVLVVLLLLFIFPASYPLHLYFSTIVSFQLFV